MTNAEVAEGRPEPMSGSRHPDGEVVLARAFAESQRIERAIDLAIRLRQAKNDAAGLGQRVVRDVLEEAAVHIETGGRSVDVRLTRKCIFCQAEVGQPCRFTSDHYGDAGREPDERLRGAKKGEERPTPHFYR